MNIIEILTLIMAGAALLGVMLDIGKRVSQKRKDFMKEGEKQQEQATLKKELEIIQAKVRDLETSITSTKFDMIEVKTNIQNIVKTLDRIESKLEKAKE